MFSNKVQFKVIHYILEANIMPCTPLLLTRLVTLVTLQFRIFNAKYKYYYNYYKQFFLKFIYLRQYR